MKFICVTLINIYQRFISPKKGFCCAHNTLHQTGSCSYAIKDFIHEKGLWNAWPDIKSRFSECTLAYQTLSTELHHLPKTDLPCILPCDVGIGECGILSVDTASTSHCLPCDIFSGFSKKTQRRLFISFSLAVFLSSYWFYGRGVGSIYIEDQGAQQSIFKRIAQRNHPKIRLLLTNEGKKYYSDIVTLESKHTEYTFAFSKSPTAQHIDNFKILDARVNIGNDFVVLGQILEEFQNPKKAASGQRFSYRIKRRWHLY